jgi:hypothetical protein
MPISSWRGDSQNLRSRSVRQSRQEHEQGGIFFLGFAMTEEIWKDIPGYEGAYQVSTHGRVKSLERIILLPSGRERKLKEKIIGHYDTVDPHYPTVCLHKNKNMKTYKIAKLVLLAFVGPCPPGMDSRHFPDRDHRNNHLINLQYGTRQENCADMKTHGTSWVGKRHSPEAIEKMRKSRKSPNRRKLHSKLNKFEVISARELYATGNYSLRALGRRFNVHSTTILALVRRYTWHNI